MSSILTVFAEDTIGVLGFAVFAVFVYILLGIAFRKYSHKSTRKTSEKKQTGGPGGGTHLFSAKTDQKEASRKDFSRNMIPENGIGGNQFYENDS